MTKAIIATVFGGILTMLGVVDLFRQDVHILGKTSTDFIPDVLGYIFLGIGIALLVLGILGIIKNAGTKSNKDED